MQFDACSPIAPPWEALQAWPTRQATWPSGLRKATPVIRMGAWHRHTRTFSGPDAVVATCSTVCVLTAGDCIWSRTGCAGSRVAGGRRTYGSPFVSEQTIGICLSPKDWAELQQLGKRQKTSNVYSVLIISYVGDKTFLDSFPYTFSSKGATHTHTNLPKPNWNNNKNPLVHSMIYRSHFSVANVYLFFFFCLNTSSRLSFVYLRLCTCD